MQESVWGEVAARREGRRRAAADPGLCAEGGWGREWWHFLGPGHMAGI